MRKIGGTMYGSGKIYVSKPIAGEPPILLDTVKGKVNSKSSFMNGQHYTLDITGLLTAFLFGVSITGIVFCALGATHLSRWYWAVYSVFFAILLLYTLIMWLAAKLLTRVRLWMMLCMLPLGLTILSLAALILWTTPVSYDALDIVPWVWGTMLALLIVGTRALVGSSQAVFTRTSSHLNCDAISNVVTASVQHVDAIVASGNPDAIPIGHGMLELSMLTKGAQ